MQYDMSELLRLAGSAQGQKLISYLQQSGGTELQQAIALAAAGNYSQAKSTLSALLKNPDAQTLLKDLEETL